MIGKLAKGRKELKKHNEGKRLTWKEAGLAKCYECCAGYADGKVDCGVCGCPLYGFMPFREKKSKSKG